MTSREIKQRRLQMYMEAEEKILQGQSYTIGDRQLSRPDLRYIQNEFNDTFTLIPHTITRIEFML